jgi:C-1 hydroxylase
MSIDENKALVSLFYEALNQPDTAAIDRAIDQYVSPSLVYHDPVLGTVPGVEVYRHVVHAYLQAFPEQHITVHQLVAEGEYVAVLHTHVARHLGPFMGMPPTDKQVSFGGLELVRLVDGKVVEFWRHDDDAGLMRQLMA